MGLALGIVQLIGALVPIITQIIQALQVAFPQKGQGPTKAALVPVVLGTAIDQQPNMLPPGVTKGQAVALASALAPGIVESMKATGALTPNLPAVGQAITPAP